MRKKVYADNAATTKLDDTAFEAMKIWLMDEYGNASQPYSFARKPKQALKEARKMIALCINALPEEIYFTSGGTESDNWAIKASLSDNIDRRSVVTSAIEHHAILNSCKTVEQMGVPVTYLLPRKEGVILPETLKNALSPNTFLASVMFANNEIGTIQPIRKLADAAHACGVLFHTDAVQAIGHVDINVKALDVDMLSASAHKFNGPKGIGFLYIRNGVSIHNFSDGGSQEFGRRAGTENIASIVGMATALKRNVDELERNQWLIRTLEKRLMTELAQNDILFVRNGGENTLPGLMSLSFAGKDGERILHRMDLLGISISTGSACDSKNTEISHVLKAIQLPEELAKGTIRISLGKNNTNDDVGAIVTALKKILL